MNYENLIVDTKEAIAQVIINRPEKLNALDYKTLRELEQFFISIKGDDKLKVVIITGAGDKAFVAGADITELKKLSVNEAYDFSKLGQSVFNLLENSDIPVIAAVNGFALGGGCELALSCHLRFISDKAKFGQPEINLGIIPGYGGTQRLSKLINKGRALEIILSGDLINADDAFSIGLANKVFNHDELMAKVWEFANKIASKPKVAAKYILQAVSKSTELNTSEGLELEAALFSACTGSSDFNEGTSAFLEKRKPTFTDN